MVVHGGQVARRLQREAQAAEREHARAARRYARAVARRERVVARARRVLPASTLAALGSGASVVVGVLTVVPTSPMMGAVTVLSGVVAARAARTLRRPPPEPVPPALPGPALPPPPPVTSSAWPAVLRLEAVREELRRLVPLVGPVGHAAAREAWEAAAEADAALRWQAARLAAVEPHRGPDPHLHTALLAGVSCQERLLAAVADLVAASADPTLGSRDAAAAQRLQDVTDRLHGLADGLRALR